ncbi:nuclear transport factor 2 family protein [Nocardioides sp. NPDC057577]|uniref:nuclear transport factor 2 family protein n=1 Tax=Nocardioides sp. NPDC057577 TaxID=3346171 RepID=UPI00366B5976
MSVEAVVDRFFAAVEAGDTTSLTEIYSPDAGVWHNYDDVTQTREESLRTLGYLHHVAGPMRYTEVRRELLPDGVVQQHVVELSGRAAGLRMPAMLRIVVDGDHVVRIEEYVDPTPLNARLTQTATDKNGSN